MKDIWTNAEVFKTLRNRENLKGKCGKCEYRYVCGGRVQTKGLRIHRRPHGSRPGLLENRMSEMNR